MRAGLARRRRFVLSHLMPGAEKGSQRDAPRSGVMFAAFEQSLVGTGGYEAILPGSGWNGSLIIFVPPVLCI